MLVFLTQKRKFKTKFVVTDQSTCHFLDTAVYHKTVKQLYNLHRDHNAMKLILFKVSIVVTENCILPFTVAKLVHNLHYLFLLKFKMFYVCTSSDTT